MKPELFSTAIVDGVVHPIRVKRLTRDEAITFKTTYMQHLDRSKRRNALKLQAPDAEALRKHEAAELEEEREIIEFQRQSVTDFLGVAPGHVWLDDEDAPIVSGADLVETFGLNSLVMGQLMTAIMVANTGTPGDKKKWNSRSPSGPGSDRPTDAAPSGATPAPTAAAASPAASSASAPATDAPTDPSGSSPAEA